MGIGTFVDRLAQGLASEPAVRARLWRGQGADRRAYLTTLWRSGLFDISPRLDPRLPTVDVVHFACNLGSVLPGRRSVVTVHDLMFRRHRRARDHVTELLLGQCLRRAGHVVAVSDRTRAEVESAFPHLRGRVTVIPHGMRRLPARDGLRRHILALAGGADPRKRVPLMIEIYREYRYTSPDPLPLVVLSRAGLLPGQRRDLLALGARLVPSATADQVDALMGDAAALLYTTAEEGFGLPIVEAAEAGTPVVMDARARVATEVLGPHCVRIDGDRKDWADGLCRAITLGPVRAALSLPDWETVAARYLELYREVQRS